MDDVMNLCRPRGSTAEVESERVPHLKVAEAVVVGAADAATGQGIARRRRIPVAPERAAPRTGTPLRPLLRDVVENRTLADVTRLADSSVPWLVQARLPCATGVESGGDE